MAKLVKSKQYYAALRQIQAAISNHTFPEGLYVDGLVPAMNLPTCIQTTTKVIKDLVESGQLFKATKGVREARKIFSSAELRDEWDREFKPGPQSVKFRSTNPRNLPDELRLWLVDLQCLANPNPAYKHGYGLSR